MRRLFLIAALFLWTPAGAQIDDATPRKIEKETFVYAVRDADTLRLDRYALLSPDSRAKPCLMFLFGGGFMTGTRDNRRFRPFFDYYARKGFVVVSIDYRLGMKRARQAGLLDEEHFTQALDMTLSMATEDLYDATAYICRHMPDVDPSRIVTCGSSAGAITVLMGEYWLCNGHPLTAGKFTQDFSYAGVIAFAGAVCDTQDSLRWARDPAPMLPRAAQGSARVLLRRRDQSFDGVAADDREPRRDRLVSRKAGLQTAAAGDRRPHHAARCARSSEGFRDFRLHRRQLRALVVRRR